MEKEIVSGSNLPKVKKKLTYYEKNRQKCIDNAIKYYYKNRDSILLKRKLKNHYYNPEKKRLYYLKNRKKKVEKPLVKKKYDKDFFTIDFSL